MSDYIPDPVELLEARQERLIDRFVDINTCMECGQSYGYEMVTANARPDAPLVCQDCLGWAQEDSDHG